MFPYYSSFLSFFLFFLFHFYQVFEFADKFRGSYNDSIGPGACPFYCDISGYQDELLWAATWLHKATKNSVYWDYILLNIKNFKSQIEGSMSEFGWDSKHAGINVLVSKVNYILGDNPLSMSYMVGYGKKFPQRVHHRASSLPSIDEHPQHIECKGGTPYFLSGYPNPNLLMGAVVGGPDIDDSYKDDRMDATTSEPTTYINAPLRTFFATTTVIVLPLLISGFLIKMTTILTTV
ncbi:hypothetical protein DH2020_048378 [Rehmannia glutinosa]|uniref:Endoglucanase n=1 Tax=Rehmannia glutinosa TaxID=99300 RepID=A0ABR0U5T2_REHGL